MKQCWSSRYSLYTLLGHFRLQTKALVQKQTRTHPSNLSMYNNRLLFISFLGQQAKEGSFLTEIKQLLPMQLLRKTILVHLQTICPLSSFLLEVALNPLLSYPCFSYPWVFIPAFRKSNFLTPLHRYAIEQKSSVLTPFRLLACEKGRLRQI